jgi:mono/diheme cytochrome c family protein
MPTYRKFRKLIFAALLLFIVFTVVYAATHQSRKWLVPDEAKQRQNPLTFSDSNMLSARDIYFQDCSNCHGNTGKGDGPESRMHDPAPADLSDSVRMAPISDGELFFKISEGLKPMPSFKRRLTEDQRWQLVLLVRSFSVTPRFEREAPSPQSNPKEKSR